jgi:hypothetical protein
MFGPGAYRPDPTEGMTARVVYQQLAGNSPALQIG